MSPGKRTGRTGKTKNGSNEGGGDPPLPPIDLPIEKISRELRDSAATITTADARILVDAYYRMQEQRVRFGNQIEALEGRQSTAILQHFNRQASTIEKQIGSALTRFAGADEMGIWMQNIRGIGPILSAGLLAHLDITKAPTVGHWWRFAGLDPTTIWKKDEKRPWNAELRALCWKIGESFVKTSGGDEPGYYGIVYAKRKEFEIAQNEAGEFADQAKRALEKKRYRDDTKAKAIYLTGKLPPAHIHARAKRYAVKLFLSHLQDRWYRHHYGKAPPMPYAITQLGHGHYIPPPEEPISK